MHAKTPFRVILLGTGTSHGVPMIGCNCNVCTSTDTRDRRTRASIAIEGPSGTVIVDTGPEFRLQCLANDLRRCDAVLYTHHHMDHVAGLDDLRRFNWLQNGALACYAQAQTIERLRGMFPYTHQDDPTYPSAKPNLRFVTIEGPLQLAGLRITPVPLLHGDLPVLGFRVGGFAYCTDVSRIPAESWDLLQGLDVLVLDALRRRTHPTHFNLEQAVDTAIRLGARQTYFTHIAHELGHAETNAGLPQNMALGFDGQVIAAA